MLLPDLTEDRRPKTEDRKQISTEQRRTRPGDLGHGVVGIEKIIFHAGQTHDDPL
ncbi:hypothetical protein [Streptomyces sp. NBC_00063]|uniref:hypothetical protein n=1 Tax=Streptomyces sp. NBC_00063 TaxID=2975638 RepID=UPI003D75093C